MLKVMTPLWATKHSSAPVGDKSGGDRRAARSLLSCALWRGMGRLWRGMGGMGRPEPLSAHTSAPATGPFGFSRITAYYASLPTISHDFPAFPRPPHPNQMPRAPSAVLARPHEERLSLEIPQKLHRIPVPTGKCAKHSVRRGSRRPPGMSRCGERNMNPS